MKIQVTQSLSDPVVNRNDVIAGIYLMQDMIAAGMPIEGITWPHGIRNGVLMISKSPWFDQLTYTWSDEALPGLYDGVKFRTQLDAPYEHWYLQSIDKGFRLIDHMRKAGVPVLGRMWPRAAERGMLVIRHDIFFNQYVYSWKE